jgi:hypothetical protein
VYAGIESLALHVRASWAASEGAEQMKDIQVELGSAASECKADEKSKVISKQGEERRRNLPG